MSAPARHAPARRPRDDAVRLSFAKISSSPVGALHLAAAGDRLCAVAFDCGRDGFERHLKRWFAGRADGPSVAFPAPILDAFEAYFAGETGALDRLPVEIHGTEFQCAVWRGLRDVPAGVTETYGALARRLGKPKAMRAVGLANGANPIPLALPCHRIIGADGSLTGFGGGIERKLWLLRHEGAII
ncbi:MAG: hypothetical protein Tsb0010_19870 [Parvularculaceae bacterium]